MSFFLKKKLTNGVVKFPGTNRKKRKTEKVSKYDEITSSDDDSQIDGGQRKEDSDDENETAQEKKLRLAKIYLEEIVREEQERLEDEEVSKDVISQRLKIDHLKQIGRYERNVADKYKSVNVSDIKILKCREQKSTVTSLCVSADDKWVFSGSKDGIVVKWCLKERKKLGIIPFVKTNADQVKGHTGSIFSMAISTDNKFLVVGDSSNLIHIWNPETLTHISMFKGHRKPVTGLCIKQNTHTLFSASNDRSIRVWTLDEMNFVETLFGHQDGITSIDVLHSDRPVTSGGRDGSIRLWKVSEESQLIFNAHPGNIDSVKLINEQNFVSGGDDGQLCVWSALKKKPLCNVPAAHGFNAINSQPHWISAVASYPHSDVIASGSQDGYIRLWKLQDRCRKIGPLLEIPVIGFVNALAFTTDGKTLVAGIGKDHKFGRWSTINSATNSVLTINLNREDVF